MPRQAELSRIRVAAGILRDDDRVLLAERVGGGPFDGLWEFPGGKIRKGEAPRDALDRELAEEIGIEVLDAADFLDVEHEYSDRSVAISFFLVSRWYRRPQGLEGQGLRWQAIAELDARELLPANAPVVAALLTTL